MATTFAELKQNDRRKFYLREMLMQNMPERKKAVVINNKVFFRDETYEERQKRLNLVFECIGDLDTLPTHFLTLHFNKADHNTSINYNSTYQSFTNSLSKAVFGLSNWKRYRKSIRSVGAIEGSHLHALFWKPRFLTDKAFNKKVTELVLGNKGWDIREQDFDFHLFNYNIEKYTMKLIPIRNAPVRDKLVIMDYCLKGITGNEESFICSGR